MTRGARLVSLLALLTLFASAFGAATSRAWSSTAPGGHAASTPAGADDLMLAPRAGTAAAKTTLRRPLPPTAVVAAGAGAAALSARPAVTSDATSPRSVLLYILLRMYRV